MAKKLLSKISAVPASPRALKTPQDSAVHMTELVLPQHTNAMGSIFGGVVMSWVDIAGAIAAQRHSGRVCVTASIDELHFLRPIKLGFVVNIEAKITAVHKTSCEVFVQVDAENPINQERFHTSSAFLTFVALDDYGRPCPMPGLKAQTTLEKRAMEHAEIRRQNRQSLRRKVEERLS